MKIGPDALGTAEHEFGRAKHENDTRRTRHRRKRVWEHKIRKRDLTTSLPSKMSTSAQNMKTAPDTLGTAKTEQRAQNMKTAPDALGTAENEFGSAKYEKGIRRPR
jgi:hypothetical protein